MTFQALGKVGVPTSGVAALSLGLNVVKPVANGTLSVYPSDKSTTIASVAFTAGESIAGADITEITATGKVTVRNNSASPIDVLVSTDGYFLSTETGKIYSPVSTQMLWDTRAAYATGSPLRTTPMSAWSSVEIDLLGQAGLPADPNLIGAVALNVGTTDPTADGDLKVEPIDSPQGISTLRFTKNDWNNSVFAIVATSHQGKLRVTNASPGTVNAVISVRGYFSQYNTVDTESRFKPISPTKIVDTAAGIGTGGSTAQVGAEQTLSFDAVAPSGVPTETIAAVALQIRAVGLRRPEGSGQRPH